MTLETEPEPPDNGNTELASLGPEETKTIFEMRIRMVKGLYTDCNTSRYLITTPGREGWGTHIRTVVVPFPNDALQWLRRKKPLLERLGEDIVPEIYYWTEGNFEVSVLGT